MEEKTLKEFLESSPPGKLYHVSKFVKYTNQTCYIDQPEINLYCLNETCQGIRYFGSREQVWVSRSEHNDKYLTYVCQNCRRSFKTFSIWAFKDNSGKWQVAKYGENPPFGPPTPSRTFKLIGGERKLFLLGRKNEIQGMGIGAFVYYRRVIENQKNRIFDELIRVINKISPGDDVINDLEMAKNETQFTKAVDSIKHSLPQSLFINGYNPLTLLHAALSEGVHEHSDDECLELAGSVRAVLFEFAERLGLALKDEAELNAAVTKLAKKKSAVDK
ncbi:MAG: hypothetical protein AB2806_21885 [Candidatus Thiodiazotropha sp.]